MSCRRFILLTAAALLTLSAAHARPDFDIECLSRYYYEWDEGVIDVEVTDHFAFLAFRNEGLRVFDISDITNPVEVDRLDVGYVRSTATHGNLAFLTGGVNLRILDISEPNLSSGLITLPYSGHLNDVAFKDHYALTGWNMGIRILDISDPRHVQTVWETDEMGAECMDVIGDIAYVGSGGDLVVMDLTDIESPQIQSSFRVSGQYGITGLSVRDGHAFLANYGNGLVVVDLAAMEIVSMIDSLRFGYGTKIDDGYLYFHYGADHCPLAKIDISVPSSPQVLGIYYPPEDLVDFRIKDNLAYVADHKHGLRIVDFSVSEEPVEVSVLNRYGKSRDVMLSGDVVYSREETVFRIYDYSNPLEPVEASCIDYGPVGFHDFALADGVVFGTVSGYDHLLAYDAADPFEPRLIGTFSTDDYSSFRDIRICGSYACCEAYNRIAVIDISDPSRMEMKASWAWEDEPHAVINPLTASESVLFISTSSQHLLALDLSTPASPELVADYDVQSNIYTGTVSGGYLYVPVYGSMLVFDATDFSDWQPLSTTPLDEEHFVYPDDLVAVGNALYLCSSYGIGVFDVTDPLNIRELGKYEVPDEAFGISVEGDRVCTAEDDNIGLYRCFIEPMGISPARSELPGSFMLHSNYPNPFNATTSIRFDLAEPGRVVLQVFDVMGRQVAMLTDANFAAGRHTLHWDGTASTGQAVASGRYYIQARAGDQVSSIPAILLK